MKKTKNTVLIVLGVLLAVFIFVFILPFDKLAGGIKIELLESGDINIFASKDERNSLIDKAETYFKDNNYEYEKTTSHYNEIEYQIKIDDVLCSVNFNRWKDVNYLYISCYDIKNVDKNKLVDLYNNLNICQITTDDLEMAINSSEITKFTLSNKAYGEWRNGYSIQLVI